MDICKINVPPPYSHRVHWAAVFVVDGLVESNRGVFYRVVGDIKRLDDLF